MALHKTLKFLSNQFRNVPFSPIQKCPLEGQGTGEAMKELQGLESFEEACRWPGVREWL